MPSSVWDHSGAWCRFRGKADWRREARRPRARPASRVESSIALESLSSAAKAGADLAEFEAQCYAQAAVA